MHRTSHRPNKLYFPVLALLLSASALTVAQPQPATTAKPLAYLRKHVGEGPYGIWKTQPLHRRLVALLGPEYQSLVGNLDPATDLAEQNGILHTEGNAPHRGGEEEAVLLVDVDNDTIEVFLRHKETIVRAWAENHRTVIIPHDAMGAMKNWPRSALAQALAGLLQASRSSDRPTSPPTK